MRGFSLVNKLPIVTVLGLIGYCLWPYLVSRQLPQLQAEKVKDFAASLLQPKFGPVPQRDPFFGRPVVHDKEAKAETKVEGAKTEQADGESRPEAPRIDKEPPFSLQATFAMGERSLAVLEGRVVQPGDVMPGHEADDPGWVVWDIDSNRVALLHCGDTVQLKIKRRLSVAAPVQVASAIKPPVKHAAPRAAARPTTPPKTTMTRSVSKPSK